MTSFRNQSRPGTSLECGQRGHKLKIQTYQQKNQRLRVFGLLSHGFRLSRIVRSRITLSSRSLRCNSPKSLVSPRDVACAKDITIGYQAGGTEGFGEGKAVTKPGTYTATIDCKSGKVTTTFTVVKPGTAQPSQVTVKPKGAPQTGGGFLAG